MLTYGFRWSMVGALAATDRRRYMKKILSKYKIGRNDACLCGSGKKYKRCCQTLIEEREKNFRNAPDYSNVAKDFFKKGNFIEAEKFYRASLTQYIIWYYEHTVPFMKGAPDAAKDLFSTDIEAINEIADSLVRTLYSQKKIDSIHLLYSALIGVIDHPLYNFYIDCQRAFWLDYANRKTEAEEILAIYTDKEICKIPATYMGERSLDTYLRFTFLKLPAVKSLAIIEKSLSENFKTPFKLFLLTYKTRIAFLHNDIEMAKKSAKHIVQELKKINEKDILQDSALHILLPDTYQMLAIILQNSTYYNKLIDICTHNLRHENKDGFFVAIQNHLISQAYISLEKIEKAKEYIIRAIESDKRFEFQLDLAKINLKLENQSEALAALNDINYNKLPEEFKIDYLSYCTDVALTNKDKKKAAETEKLLAAVKTSIPYFQTLINGFRSLLLDFIASKQEGETLLMKLRRFAAEKLILQPNICGIGINLNDILKPKEKD